MAYTVVECLEDEDATDEIRSEAEEEKELRKDEPIELNERLNWKNGKGHPALKAHEVLRERHN